MCFYDDISTLKEKYPNIRLDVSFDEYEHLKGKKLMVLDAIVVPKDMRKRGIGTSIMKELVLLARRYNCVFILSPDHSLDATSKARLRRFYKRFGFVDNKGRRKLYPLPMYSMYFTHENLRQNTYDSHTMVDKSANHEYNVSVRSERSEKL